MRDMTEEELAAVYDRGCCPFCGEEGYYPGPVGGMMLNITTACGARLNIVHPDCWSAWYPRVGQVLEEPPPQENGQIGLSHEFIKAIYGRIT